MGERATEGSNSGGVRGTPFVSGHGKVPTFIPCRCAFLQACNRRRRPRHAAAKVRTLRTTVRSARRAVPCLRAPVWGGVCACGWPVGGLCGPVCPAAAAFQRRSGGEWRGRTVSPLHVMAAADWAGGSAHSSLGTSLDKQLALDLAPAIGTPPSGLLPANDAVWEPAAGGAPPRGQRAKRAPPGPAGIRPSPHTGQWQGAMALP